MTFAVLSSDPIPASPLARAAPLWLVIVVVGVAIFCTDHGLFVSQREDYAADADQLEVVATSGSWSSRLGFALLALLGGALLARQRGRPWCLAGLLPLLLLLLVAWCLASTLWSADAGRTVRRVGALLFCFVGALGVGRQLTARDLCRLTLVVTAGYAALGVGVELGLGTLRPFASEYRFAGTLHPNEQGANCAFLCLSAVLLLGRESRGRARGLLLALLVAGAGLLLLTKSRTSIGALLAALVAVRCARPSARLGLVALGVVWAVCGLALLASLLEVDLQQRFANLLSMGRDEEAGTLTGRTELWAELLPYVRDRFVIGYGFGSFWSAQHIDAVSSALSWGISSAHSAYLDCVLSIGLVGAALVGLIIVSGIWRAVARYRATGNPGHGLIIGLLVYGMVEGVSESDFIVPCFASFLVACGLCHLGFCRGEEAAGRPGQCHADG